MDDLNLDIRRQCIPANAPTFDHDKDAILESLWFEVDAEFLKTLEGRLDYLRNMNELYVRFRHMICRAYGPSRFVLEKSPEGVFRHGFLILVKK